MAACALSSFPFALPTQSTEQGTVLSAHAHSHSTDHGNDHGHEGVEVVPCLSQHPCQGRKGCTKGGLIRLAKPPHAAPHLGAQSNTSLVFIHIAKYVCPEALRGSSPGDFSVL